MLTLWLNCDGCGTLIPSYLFDSEGRCPQCAVAALRDEVARLHAQEA